MDRRRRSKRDRAAGRSSRKEHGKLIKVDMGARFSVQEGDCESRNAKNTPNAQADASTCSRQTAFFNKSGTASQHYLQVFGSKILTQTKAATSEVATSSDMPRHVEVTRDKKTNRHTRGHKKSTRPDGHKRLSNHIETIEKVEEAIRTNYSKCSSTESPIVDEPDQSHAVTPTRPIPGQLAIYKSPYETVSSVDIKGRIVGTNSDEDANESDDEEQYCSATEPGNGKDIHSAHIVNGTIVPFLKLVKAKNIGERVESPKETEYAGIRRGSSDPSRLQGINCQNETGTVLPYNQSSYNRQGPYIKKSITTTTTTTFMAMEGTDTFTKPRNFNSVTASHAQEPPQQTEDASAADSDNYEHVHPGEFEGNAQLSNPVVEQYVPEYDGATAPTLPTAYGTRRTPGDYIERRPLPEDNTITFTSAIGVSRSCRFIVLGNERGELYIWDSMDFVNLHDGEKSATKCNERVTNRGNPNRLHWEMLSCTPTAGVKAHEVFLTSVDVTDVVTAETVSTAMVVTAGDDNSVRVWLLTTAYNGTRVLTLIADKTLEEGVFRAFKIAGSPPLIVSSNCNGLVHLWSTTAMDLSRETISGVQLLLPARDIIDFQFTISNATASPSGKFFAIGSTDGLIKLYGSKSNSVKGIAYCRNTSGIYSGGTDVSGISWNRNETLMCITTADSRIRIYYSRASSGEEMVYLEKLKGHKHYASEVVAKFTGAKEEFIVCPSRGGFLYFWRHHQDPVNPLVDARAAAIKNKSFCKFKISTENIIEQPLVLSPGTWGNFVSTYHQQNNAYHRYHQEPTNKFIRFLTRECKAEEINAGNANVENSFLVLASENGCHMLCSVIQLDWLKFK